jgi:hypothetical protein
MMAELLAALLYRFQPSPLQLLAMVLKAFADRGYVTGGAEAVGRPMLEHVAFVIEALKPIVAEIGL